MTAISVVIPAYNEEQRLPATLNAITEYLAARQWETWEVLVVNDGSGDGTAALAAHFGEENPSVKLVENPGNRGKGYSVRHGMLLAKGDWILFTDSDLSAPITELDKLIEAAHANKAQVVIGSRAVNRRMIEVRQSWFRETAGRVFNLIMRTVTGLPFADTQCGFKLFERKAAKEIFRRQQIERWGFDAEVLFIARKLGYKTLEVPVRWRHAEGTKVSMFKDSVNMFADLFRIRWNQLRGLYS